jgi:hypothetical protein
LELSEEQVQDIPGLGEKAVDDIKQSAEKYRKQQTELSQDEA